MKGQGQGDTGQNLSLHINTCILALLAFIALAGHSEGYIASQAACVPASLLVMYCRPACNIGVVNGRFSVFL